MHYNFAVNNIPIDAVDSILKLKLSMYSWIFHRIASNQGRFPYPAWFVAYLNELDVEHWAEYYFKEKLIPIINEAKSDDKGSLCKVCHREFEVCRLKDRTARWQQRYTVVTFWSR